MLEGKLEQLAQRVAQMGQAQVAQRIGVGEPTLRDMVAELSKPGRDPRDELPKPLLRTDVMEMSDLKEGMVLTGTVRNVTDFGAFVDIAVHEDGLVHISQISNGASPIRRRCSRLGTSYRSRCWRWIWSADASH